MLLLGTHEHVIEEEEMSQLSAAISELHSEAVLDKMTLGPFLSLILVLEIHFILWYRVHYLMRVQFAPVLHVVVIEKVLDHVKRVVEGGIVRMIFGCVLDPKPLAACHG